MSQFSVDVTEDDEVVITEVSKTSPITGGVLCRMEPVEKGPAAWVDPGLFRDEVARGAALLDEEIPHWRDLINLFRLDMSTWRTGVIGQLQDWGYEPARHIINYDRLRDHGFMFDENQPIRHLREFNKTWVSEIKRGRSWLPKRILRRLGLLR